MALKKLGLYIVGELKKEETGMVLIIVVLISAAPLSLKANSPVGDLLGVVFGITGLIFAIIYAFMYLTKGDKFNSMIRPLAALEYKAKMYPSSMGNAVIAAYEMAYATAVNDGNSEMAKIFEKKIEELKKLYSVQEGSE